MLREENIIEEEEFVTHVMEEASFNDTIGEIEDVVDLSYLHDQCVISVNSVDMYTTINEYNRGILMKEAEVNTKYKTVDKKIKPVAVPLPEDSWLKMKEVANDPSLRDPKTIGHVFTKETKEKLRVGREDFLLPEEERMFRDMLERHGKAFAFSPREIGCADPRTIEPMVIFTVPHVPWNLKPIPVPRAHLPKLIELLKEKVSMGILEPSNAPYSNRWFTVPKKNGSLRFIQDLQPVNKVTIRNAGIGPSVDEFAEAFAGRSIYSIGDLYSGYDQFQLAIDSRDITTMRTPIGLVRMCTLPQGATNSVAHMVNAMNKVLKDCIPNITMPFLDDIPIKGCSNEEKDESKGKEGCRKFVADHMKDCEKVLQRLEDANLTFSGEKSAFGQPEILVVGHLCGAYGRKPSPSKVNAIQDMKEECENQTEVRRFLGACAFYHIWIPHYAHVAEPLYGLLKKRMKFEWRDEHTIAMRRLKKLLLEAPALRKANYTEGKPVYVTVDTSPTGIGWVINQEGEGNARYAIRFGAKVLSERQRRYAQVKRELWGIVSAVKTDKDYLIGSEVIIETDCLPILGMISGCTTPDLAMLRWIAYIKSLNPDICHIAGKKNAMADMLSRARFESESEMVSEEEDVALDFFKMARLSAEDKDTQTLHAFNEDEYEGEWLLIGRFLRTMTMDASLTKEEAQRIRKKAYQYFLKGGFLWRHPKRRTGIPRRVVVKKEDQMALMIEFHESAWAGHRGTWATFEKMKEKYWWPSMYKDVLHFVSTCETCQVHSNIRHRDELRPTYPPTIHFKWMVDLVSMPMGVGQMKYLVLAREDLTNQVEGRALTNKTTSAVCKFLLEEVICRYGCVGKIVADRGELDAHEATELFERLGVKLSLTTAYNPEANGKIERGHGPIVKAIVRACNGRVGNWPRLLPYALWADRTTHSSVTGYMPTELMYGQKPVMPIERTIASWVAIPWENEMSREELLAARIRQLERRPEDLEKARKMVEAARVKNKVRFDKTHRLRPKKIEEGDWVLVYDNSLDNQHSTTRKFARRWFGPYVVTSANDNATYHLAELDGSRLAVPIAGKRVKIFKKRQDKDPDVDHLDDEHNRADVNEDMEEYD
jgi:transposase InsO family protein